MATNFSRRGLFGGAFAALAAPAIIRTPGLLMPVKRLLSANEVIPLRYLGLSALKVEGASTAFDNSGYLIRDFLTAPYAWSANL